MERVHNELKVKYQKDTKKLATFTKRNRQTESGKTNLRGGHQVTQKLNLSQNRDCVRQKKLNHLQKNLERERGVT